MNWLLIAVLVVAVYFLYRNKTKTPRARDVLSQYEPVGTVLGAVDLTRGFSEDTVAACRRFDALVKQSYDYVLTNAGKRMGGTTFVTKLFEAREDALMSIGEMRMSLPNDLDAEMQFVAAADSLDKYMMDVINDARKRLNTGIHPGQIADHGDVRAANDVWT
jgi:hypothetical protein